MVVSIGDMRGQARTYRHPIQTVGNVLSIGDRGIPWQAVVSIGDMRGQARTYRYPMQTVGNVLSIVDKDIPWQAVVSIGNMRGQARAYIQFSTGQCQWGVFL